MSDRSSRWFAETETEVQFYDLDPMDCIDLDHDTATSRALRHLAKLDHAYRPKSTGLQARAGTDADLNVFGRTDLTCSCTYQKG